MNLLKRMLPVRDQAQFHSDSRSIILLGFASPENDEPRAFCAVTWSGSKEQPSDLRIFLKCGWESQVPDWLLQYLTDLLSDWRQWAHTQPARVISLINELSVGPVRAVQESKIRRQTVAEFIKEALGDAEPLTSLSIVK